MLVRWWKQRYSNRLVGLDINPFSIKVLQINSAETPPVVENFGMELLPPGVTIKDDIKDYSTVSNALKKLFKQADIKLKDVALAIPRSSVIIKNTTIDSRLKPSEIESRAWIEANRHFPDLVGQIYLDYTILGPSEQDASQLELMLVASRKEQVDPYLEILRQAGLTAKVVDVNCYALERALAVSNPSQPETLALLNLDTGLSSVVVEQHKKQIYAHDHTYDARRLIEQVQKYLATPEGIASKGILEDAAYLQILKENISTHLRHCMHFFYSSRPHATIQQIILSGDLTTIPSLAAFTQQETGVETLIANPFANMTIASNVNEKKLREHAATLMTCSGLGLSHVEV